MRCRFKQSLAALLGIVVIIVAAADLGGMCCNKLPFEPNAGTVAYGRTVADSGAIAQTSGSNNPWYSSGWWVHVQELRNSDDQPYPLALVLLNDTYGNPYVTGRNDLITPNTASSHVGLSAFSVYPSTLRAGTTNYIWKTLEGTPASYLRYIRIHRSNDSPQMTSARLELKRGDGSVLYEQTWLWDSSLVFNTIELTLPIDNQHGPTSEIIVSVWGSGYAAIGAFDICQLCVTSSPTPSPSASMSQSKTPSPSAPPTQGVACNTGSAGVCAEGTWQRNSAGNMVCVMLTMPSVERCDGLDNDCDGLIDEDMKNKTVSCGVGECYETYPTCSNGMLVQCIPGVPLRQDDPCDGLDNNCNGQIDEGYPLIACGIGECRQTVQSCVDGIKQSCMPYNPTPERCDGLDNDCDGLVDEDNVCNYPTYALPVETVFPIPTCIQKQLQPDGSITCYADMGMVNNMPSASSPTNTNFYEVTTCGELLDNCVHVQEGPIIQVSEQNIVTTAFSTVFSCGAMAIWEAGSYGYASITEDSPLCSTLQSDGGIKNVSILSLVDDIALLAQYPVIPLVTTCVDRRNGYCTVYFGYFNPALTIINIAVPTDTSTASALSASNRANKVFVRGSGQQSLAQNQPHIFYPGTANRALVIRTECPVETLSEWGIDWLLGSNVASVRATELCV